MTTICQVCGIKISAEPGKEEHTFLLCDRCCTHERCGEGDWSKCDCFDCGASMIDNVHNCPNPSVHLEATVIG